MCALAALLPCPLCLNPHFESVEKLRDKLIFVSTQNLMCPVCHEQVAGLDKLTIHLFGHVKMRETIVKNLSKQSETERTQCENKNNVEKSQVCKRPRTQTAKNKIIASSKAPVKFVKIYPKLPVISLNTMPFIEFSHNPLGESIKKPLCLSTIPSVNNQVVSRIEAININIQCQCDICGLQFKDEHILKMHKSLIHNLKEDVTLNLDNFQCHLCSKRFKMKGSLMVHMRVVHYGIPSHNITNDTTSKPVNSEFRTTTEASMNAKVHLLDRCDNKQWFCDVCEKSFTTKYFLKKHKRLHTGETPYACVQCNKTFTFQQSYHKHLLYHNDEKPHSCSYCGRSFKELSTLHNHQRIHTGEKPFSCETCGKCFRQRVSYLVHRRIHTGVMPYKCTACDKSFRYKVSQRTHKCPAQPPGTVVRQSGELLEKLKKKHTVCDSSAGCLVKNNQEDIYCNILEANAEVIRSGAKLSFEDTEAENFSLLSKSPNSPEISNSMKVYFMDNSGDCSLSKNLNNVEGIKSTASNVSNVNVPINSTIGNMDKNIPSPSEILKNLCLANYHEEYNESRICTQTHDELNLDVIYKEFNDLL